MDYQNDMNFILNTENGQEEEINEMFNSEEEEIKNIEMSRNSNTRKRYQFTKEEDQLLIYLVQLFGIDEKKKWTFISQHMKGRNVRQCRERYQLYLNTNIKKKEKWTFEDVLM